MKAQGALLAVLLMSSTATMAWAQGPKISAPDQTDGVLERVIDMPMTSSLRPLPRPEWMTVKAAETAVSDAALSLETLPLLAMEAKHLSGQIYALNGLGDPKLTIQNALGETPARTIAFAITPTEAFFDAVRVAKANEPKITLDPMAAAVMNALEGSYLTGQEDGESGYDRLLSLAENGGIAHEPAMVSAEAYDFPEAEPSIEVAGNLAQPGLGSVGTVMGMDPAAALLNSLSKEHLANMTPDQLTALVMAAHGRPLDLRTMGMGQQQAAQMPAGYASAPLSGIPSLDYRGDSLPTPQVISAADVPAGSMPFSQTAAYTAPAPQPVRVGDGKNLLLKGWTLGLTGSGQIGMYMTGDPGSIVEISEGMVVGQLGAIESLDMQNGNIIARFSSGEVMTSPAALVSMASL